MSRLHDMGDSLRRVAATFVEIVHTRLELASTELAEERARLAQQMVAAVLALFCAGTAMVLGVVALAWWAGPDRAAAVLAASASVLLVAALAAAAWWQRIIANRPSLLGETLAQLQADAKALAAEH